MAVEKVDIEKFLQLAETFPVLDVRSPAEYLHAHIPGAFSVPVFTDEQRKIIGTAYVQQSRQAAVNHGLQYFSERMKVLAAEVESLKKKENAEQPPAPGTFLVHCWRGGMRSDAVAWLLNLYGYKIYLLKGGYKAFRRWALSQFEKEYDLKVLGGFTGSGKTQILHELDRKGEKVIDLERLASHKGSAFGSLGESPQPSSEMFENLLAIELRKTAAPETDSMKYPQNFIWVEDESAHIGTVGIPKAFWQQMRKSRLYFLDIPFEERVKNITSTYGIYDQQLLIDCVLKIQKRLGGLNSKNVIQFISQGDMQAAFSVLLMYYDKMYFESLYKREGIESLMNKIPCTNTQIDNALLLLAE